MATIQLKDFFTIEKNLNGKEYLFTSQDDKTRKVELDKVKEFIIGTGQLMTTDQSSIINAINEIQQVILNQSGGAGQLQTELDKIKEDYVSKTNDLLKNYTVGTSDNSLVPTVQALTDVYNILKNLIDIINKNIGDKSKLATIDSSTLVNAINEINTRIQTAETFCNEVESMIGGRYDASTEGTLVERIKALETNIATNQANWEDKYTKAEIDNKISQVVSNMDWKESVATYNDIATTYSNPQDGWTVNVKDTDITYRWDGSKWIEISANAIPLATSSVDGKMSKTDKSFLDTVKGLWNSVTTHIGDAVKHITSSERTLWNTVSNKLDKTGDTMTGTLDINSAGELRKTTGDRKGVILAGDEEIVIRGGISGTDLLLTDTEFSYGGNNIYHAGNLTKVSQLTNDAGYITQSDVDTSQNHTHANKATLDKITEEKITSWDEKLDSSKLTGTNASGGINYNSVPQINDDGVIEIGKYIDFHIVENGTTDHDVRLEATADTLKCTKPITADLNGTATKATQDGVGNVIVNTYMRKDMTWADIED